MFGGSIQQTPQHFQAIVATLLAWGPRARNPLTLVFRGWPGLVGRILFAIPTLLGTRCVKPCDREDKEKKIETDFHGFWTFILTTGQKAQGFLHQGAVKPHQAVPQEEEYHQRQIDLRPAQGVQGGRNLSLANP